MRPGGSLGDSQKYRGEGQRPFTPSPLEVCQFLSPCWTLLWGPQIRVGPSLGLPWGHQAISWNDGGPWGTLGDVWKPPEGVQSHFKTIEKRLGFIALLSIEVVWNLSGGGARQPFGVLEVLFGVDIAQKEDLGRYFRFL